MPESVAHGQAGSAVTGVVRSEMVTATPATALSQA